DTLELWKFGDYKHYTSLELLTNLFGIPSPKDDIDGSQVADVYYKEKDIGRIAAYCEKDVVALTQLFLRYKGESLIEDENIQSVSNFSMEQYS
ncbi:MAG: 3'-5' exonuclease, partial [Bacteroidota bacterium]|nr:3'-5' exonuclease [Bacteroidota bacterium]